MRGLMTGLLAAGMMIVPGAQASCHAALKQRLPQSGTVIFGEMHGTNEIPAFFSACVTPGRARRARAPSAARARKPSSAPRTALLV